MAELYKYEAYDGTVYDGISITEALKLKQKDEEEKQRSAQAANLGPKISAGIRAYEAGGGAGAQLGAQPDQMVPEPPAPDPGFVGPRQPAPAQQAPVARFGEDGFNDVINSAVQEQQASTPKQFESLQGGDGALSNMGGVWPQGQTEQEIGDIYSQQQRMEKTMSAPMLKLLQDVPPEVADDLIARYRMGDLKPDAFMKQIVSIKGTLRKDAAERRKEEFSSSLKINEQSNKDLEANIRNIDDIESAEKIAQMNNERALEIARLNARTKLALQRDKDAKKKGKDSKEVKGLMDINRAFEQLQEEHSGIWTGPVAGVVGRANLVSQKRAKFNATRALVLKTIAKSFEGARMSDIDMKFYERMVPNDIHTKKQFGAIKESIMNLVEWRIKRFNEAGVDPGEMPPEEPATTQQTTGATAQPNKVVNITSDEEYNALESGTEFIGPDGVKRRKP